MGDDPLPERLYVAGADPIYRLKAFENVAVDSYPTRPDLQPASANPPRAFLLNKTGADQHLDVPGNGLHRDIERCGQFGDEKWPPA